MEVDFSSEMMINRMKVLEIKTTIMIRMRILIVGKSIILRTMIIIIEAKNNNTNDKQKIYIN